MLPTSFSRPRSSIADFVSHLDQRLFGLRDLCLFRDGGIGLEWSTEQRSPRTQILKVEKTMLKPIQVWMQKRACSGDGKNIDSVRAPSDNAWTIFLECSVYLKSVHTRPNASVPVFID